jgi:hypothetical protein
VRHLPGAQKAIRGPDRTPSDTPSPASEGFAEFVAARFSALRATAWLLTGDEGRAEDLVQEALARTWRVWPRVRSEGSAEPYVRKVMVNLNISWWRRRWRSCAAAQYCRSLRFGPVLEVPQHEHRPLSGGQGGEGPRDGIPEIGLAAGVLSGRISRDGLRNLSTVKSQAHRGIARLRTDPHLQELMPSFRPPKRGTRCAHMT